MKKWIIYGVLLCSLTFNVIFITKAFQYRRKFPPLRHHQLNFHKRRSLRKFLDSKRSSLRKNIRESNHAKDRLICKFLEDNLSQEELELLRDSLLNITVERENKFINYLIEYKTQEKEKLRSER